VKLKHSEHKLQCAIVDFFHIFGRRDLKLFAIGNGGLRHIKVAMLLKAEGVTPGVPDLCLPLPDGKTGWMELKSKSGRLSDEQTGFLHMLRELGHHVAVIRSVDEAARALSEWQALRPGAPVPEEAA